ncbi:putative transcription factor bHLH family [Dioscorea sansibarensis]
MKSATEGSKMERKTVEKNRRLRMKRLCSQLSSLIPKDELPHTKEVLTQPDHLEQAAKYIKELKERLEKLKEQRRGMMMNNIEGMDTGCSLPVIEVRHLDSTLEVLLISGIHSKTFMFHEVISLLEEEGAEVLNANFSVVGDKIFHTIHSKAVSSRIGLDTTRVSERLRQLVR